MNTQKVFLREVVATFMFALLLSAPAHAKSTKEDKKNHKENCSLLEGQNCTARLDSGVAPSGDKNLNSNRDSQKICEMCQTFQGPLDFPAIVSPEKLFYKVDFGGADFSVPPCQKDIFPPLTPEDKRLSLKCKNVLIIGGSRLNGKTIAKRFVKEGANVVITTRHPECFKKPKHYKVKQLDIRFEKDVKNFIDHVAKKYFNGKIDILINSIGQAWNGPLSDATGDDLINSLQVTIAGLHRVTHYALPYMGHSSETRVISFGSLDGTAILNYNAGASSIGRRGLQHWNDILQVEQLTKKAQGLIKDGPSFTLLETFFVKSSLALFEYYRPSELTSENPLVVGPHVLEAASSLFNGQDPCLIAEAAFRVAVAPQPGVRYATITPAQKIELPLPDGTKREVSVLSALQLGNSLSQDEAINTIMQPFNLARINNLQKAKNCVAKELCVRCRNDKEKK